jgi:uncharacterized protein YrzB (UPF0473 family)
MADNKEMMNENEGEREFYTLVDADTNEEIEFEKIAEVELGGKKYVAMIPASDEIPEDGFYEYVILRVEESEEGVDFVSVDDEKEAELVEDAFDQIFSEEIDYDGK